MNNVRKKVIMGLMILSVLAVTGCSFKKPNQSNGETKGTDATKEYATDSSINMDVPLIEISRYLTENNYSLEYAAMKSDSEIVVALLNKDELSLLLKSYDIVKGKVHIEKKISVDESFFEDEKSMHYYYGVGLFVENVTKGTYIVFNEKLEQTQKIDLSNGKFRTITPDASRIVYCDNNNKIYSYSLEGENSSLIYQFENEIELLQCVGVTGDVNHILYRYNNTKTQKIGYADIQMEEHTATYKEGLTYTIAIANDEYVYFDYWKQHNQLCFYSFEKPREIRMFELDSEKETDNITFFRGNEYFASCIVNEGKDENKYELKLYNSSEGVLIEKTLFAIDNDLGIVSITMSPNTEIVCISGRRNDVGSYVFVWNLAISSGAIEENPVF